MKSMVVLGTILAISVSAAGVSDAHGAAHWYRGNAAGGITAGGVHNFVGPNGARVAGGHRVVTDGNGNGKVTSGGCAAGANAAGCRAGRTTWNADGSVSHKSGFAAKGVNGGTASSSGSVTRNPDGSYSGNRTTGATGPNGGTYNATTSYGSGTGPSRTVSCTNSSGAVVACPGH